MAPTSSSSMGSQLASSSARSNAWRRVAVDVLHPGGVGAHELQLAEPQRREVGAGAGDPAHDDAPAGLRGAQAHVERAAASPCTRGPRRRRPAGTPCPRSGVSFTALSARRTALVACSGRTTSVAPATWRRRAAAGAWPRTIRAGVREAAARAISVSRPTVPAPTTSTSPPSGTRRAQGGVDRARERLDQHAPCGRPSRRGPPRAASGARASCRLQPPPVSAQ